MLNKFCTSFQLRKVKQAAGAVSSAGTSLCPRRAWQSAPHTGKPAPAEASCLYLASPRRGQLPQTGYTQLAVTSLPSAGPDCCCPGCHCCPDTYVTLVTPATASPDTSVTLATPTTAAQTLLSLLLLLPVLPQTLPSLLLLLWLLP